MSMKYIDIVFSGEGPSLEFVEVEYPEGVSISVGDWLKPDQNGLSRLRIPASVFRSDDRPGLGPQEVTKEELQKILLETIQAILRNGVTIDALNEPGSMDFQDIVANLHLYERLGVAFDALGTLNGYKGRPRGFRLK